MEALDSKITSICERKQGYSFHWKYIASVKNSWYFTKGTPSHFSLLSLSPSPHLPLSLCLLLTLDLALTFWAGIHAYLYTSTAIKPKIWDSVLSLSSGKYFTCLMMMTTTKSYFNFPTLTHRLFSTYKSVSIIV